MRRWVDGQLVVERTMRRSELRLADGEFLDLSGGDLLDAAAQLADGIGGDDPDVLVAKFRVPSPHAVLEVATFRQQPVENLILGNIGDALALNVDDASAVAGEDRDVGAFRFAGAVDYAPHHRHFDGQGDLIGQFLSHLLHEREQVDLNPATGWTGNEFGAEALPQAEAIQHLQGVLDFVNVIGGVADAHRVADAVGQQRPQRDDAADSAGFFRPGVGDAQVQRIVEPLGNFRVHVDHHARVHRLGAEAKIVKIALGKDVQVFFKFGDHQRNQMPVAMVAEELPELLHSSLFVLALDDGAFVDADAYGDAGVLARIDDTVDLITVGDVAGVKSDLVYAGFDCLERPLIVEVDVGDDGDDGLAKNLLQGGGVLALRDGDADDIRSRGGEPIDFRYTGVDVVGVAGRHGLDGNRGIAADRDNPGPFVADVDRFGGAS